VIRSCHGGLAVILLAAVVAAPVALHAQSAKTARVGVLLPSDDSTTTFLPAFRQGLRDLGYVEGRTVSLEVRSANGRTDRLPSLARELVRMKVDVLVTITSPGVRAAREATSTIPIVAGAVDDAVEQGFVASLAHPGGNVTGVSWLNTELSAKRLELLKEALPEVTRVAVLREAVGGVSSIQATATAARALRVHLQIFELRDPNELPTVFAAMAKDRIEALTVLPGPLITSQIPGIVELASRTRLPAVFPEARFVEAGGMMSYGPNLAEMYRRGAGYVDKILKGVKPSNLPVEQPTKFESIINLKTAKALGLTIPPSLLQRADQVIE
jgi:putative tryptophan/tyrosine transport system substrate-binding protein